MMDIQKRLTEISDKITRLERSIEESNSRILFQQEELNALKKSHLDLLEMVRSGNETAEPIAPTKAAALAGTPSGPATSDREQPAVEIAGDAPVGEKATGESILKPKTPSVPLASRLSALVREKIGHIPVEEFIGVNLLNKIGILILVVGISFFLKIAYSWIGPGVKVAFLSLVGAAAAVAGDFFNRREKYHVFGMGLIAAGSSIVYFTAYAAANIEATRIIPTGYNFAGYALLIVISLIIIANSLRYRSEALTGFAYFLGFLTISINETGEFGFFSLVSLAILAAGLIVTMTIMRWKYLSGPGIVVTYANFYLYAQSLQRSDGGYVFLEEFFFSLAFLAVFWLIFMVSTFTIRINRPRDKSPAVMINVSNAFIFLGLMAYIRPQPQLWGAFLGCTAFGLIYISAAIIARLAARQHLFLPNLIIGITLCLLAVPFRFSDYALIFGWLAQGLVLVTLGFALREISVRYFGYAALILKLGVFLTLPTGDILFSASKGVSFITLDLNRGLLYIFMFVGFGVLQILSSRHRRDWRHLEGGLYQAMGIVILTVVTLLAYFSVETPFQSLLMLPVAVLFLAAGHLLKIREWIYYAAVLMAISFLSATPLLFSPAGGREILSGVTLFAVALTPLTIMFYLLHPWPAEYFAADHLLFHENVERSRRFRQTFISAILWIPATAVSAIIVHFALEEIQVPLIFLLIGAFLALYRFRRLGFSQIMALLVLGSIFCLFFYLSAIGIERPGVSASDMRIFLVNDSLYIILLGILYHTYFIRPDSVDDRWRRSEYPMIFLLTLPAIFILDSVLDIPWLAVSLLGYVFFLSSVAFVIRRDAPDVLSSIFQFALYLSGILWWALTARDIHSVEYLIAIISLALLSGATSALKIKKPVNENMRDLSFVTTAALLFTIIYLLVPIDWQPGFYALLTLLYVLSIQRFNLQRPKKLTALPVIMVIISYVYLLIRFADSSPDFNRPLGAIAGLLPLVLLAFTMSVKSRLAEDASPEMIFVKTVMFLLFIGFILLTMTLIDIRWWSLVWTLEALSLLGIGLYFNNRVLRLGGFGLLILALAKLGVWDLKNLSDNIRVAVLVGIGILIVLASLLYSRFRDQIFPSGRSDETSS